MPTTPQNATYATTVRSLLPGEFGSMDRVTVYEDTAGEWRWQRTSVGNHEPLAMSSEGHPDHDHARDMAARCNRGPFVLIDDADKHRSWVVE